MESSDQASMPWYLLALLTAAGAGTAAQGAYYASGRTVLVGMVAVAVVTAAFGRRHAARPTAGKTIAAVVVAAVAFGLWALLRAMQTGGYGDAVAAVVTLACVVTGLALVRGCGQRERGYLAAGLAGIGVAVAALGWAGVTWRIDRFVVLVDHAMWRAGSTLTYPNATAAVLATVELLVLARLLAHPRSLAWLLAAYLVLVGLGATASRAGALGLLAGLVVLAGLAGVRVLVGRLLPVVAGTAVALVGLAPSFPVDHAPQPVASVLGLAVGAALCVGLTLVRGRWKVTAWAVLVGLGTVVAVHGTGHAFRQVAASRLSLDSSGRGLAARAAYGVIRQHPLTGTGIGQAWLSWPIPGGNYDVAQYVHDEYLQVLLELGVVGAALLLCLFVAFAAAVGRGWRRPLPDTLRAGALAACAAFAVHSGFDFLWHLAVLPFLAGLYLGLATPVPQAAVPPERTPPDPVPAGATAPASSHD